MVIDDISTAIRDQFRSLPDEFVTGPLGDQEDANDEQESNSLRSLPTKGDSIEPFLNSVGKVIALLEKTCNFGIGKKDDEATLAKEIQAAASFQQKNGFKSQTRLENSPKEKWMKITSSLSRIGSHWKDFAVEYDQMVLEPLRTLQDVLQGYKELIDRCNSEKSVTFEHKKNAEKIQNMRQRKVSGPYSSDPNLISSIETRIGQLHVDALDKRRENAAKCLSQETLFVLRFTGKISFYNFQGFIFLLHRRNI